MTAGITHIAKFGVANLAARSISILTAIALTPVIISVLGVDAFAIWVLATQIPSLLISPDLGLANGVTNHLVKSFTAAGNLQAERPRLEGLVRILRAVAVSWLVLGFAIAAIYAGQTTAKMNVFTSLCIGLTIFVASIPSTVWRRAQLVEGKGHRWPLHEAVARTIALLLSLGCLTLSPNLYLLVIVTAAPLTVASWANARSYKRGWNAIEAFDSVAPSIRVAIMQNRKTLRLGGAFVLLQVGYVANVAIDPYLIAAFRSPQDLAYITVLRRPLDLIPLSAGVFVGALWPIYTSLQVQENWRTLRRATLAPTGLLTLIGLTVTGLLLGTSKYVYGFLSSDEFSVGFVGVVAVGVQLSAVAGVMVLTTFMNAVNLIRSQVAIMIASSAIMIPSKLVALTTSSLDTYLVVSSVTYIAFVVVPSLLLCVRWLQSREGIKCD